MDKVEAWEREVGAGIQEEIWDDANHVRIGVKMAFKKAKRKKLRARIENFVASILISLIVWLLALGAVIILGMQVHALLLAWEYGWSMI